MFILTLSVALVACGTGGAPAGTTPPASDSPDKTVRVDDAVMAYEPVLPAGDSAKTMETKQGNPADGAYMKGLHGFADGISSAILSGGKNSVCSPVSLYMALSLAAAGANGKTRDEMFSVLGLAGKDAAYLSKETGKLFQTLFFDNKITKLKVANSLWLQKGVPFKQAYIDDAVKDFYASLYNVDYASKETPKRMGQWISDNTNGVLKPEVQVDPNLILTILNTVYLKDEWMDRFTDANTKKDSFRLADGSKTECDFMHRKIETGRYVKGDGFQSCSLALKNAGEVVLILPDEGIGVDRLLSEAGKTGLFSTQKEAKGAMIELALPKFTFGSDYQLADTLKKMGMETAFEGGADFSLMTDGGAIISNVRQQAHVAADENGVEAAAFTQIMMAGGAMIKDSVIPMKFDRPFLFAILSQEGAPLFTGLVADPADKN